MVPHIPLEVITEILTRLPVKSLLKFRVVCKSWCFLISTKQFVRKHLSSSNTSNPKRVIHLSPKDLTFYSLHDSMLVEESSPIEFPIENFLPHWIENLNIPHWIEKFKEERSSFIIMGYCDGLLCVKAYISMYSLIFLWNPSTRDSKMLPYTPEVVDNFCLSCCGFGYDYNSDDYKVLTVVSLHPYYDYSCKSYKSMLFTLRTNSWRRIQDFPLDTGCKWADNKSATFVNGALHWMAIRLEFNNPWLIISFDLTTETYMEVEHFGSTRVDQFAGIGIGASNSECLCLLVINRAILSYEYWVMKEYGVRESWTISARIRCVDNATVTVRPWFSENGYILFNGIGKLAIYNSNNNSVRHLYQLPRNYSSTHGHAYVESLVSPNSYSDRGANEIRRLSINVSGVKRLVL